MSIAIAVFFGLLVALVIGGGISAYSQTTDWYDRVIIWVTSSVLLLIIGLAYSLLALTLDGRFG